MHCIVARRGTPSECLLLAGGFSAGRSDLRLLSGDAFSVCNCNYLSFCWGVCSNFVRLLHPPLFCRISEFGSSIIPRVCNSHCRKATKGYVRFFSAVGILVSLRQQANKERAARTKANSAYFREYKKKMQMDNPKPAHLTMPT